VFCLVRLLNYTPKYRGEVRIKPVYGTTTGSLNLYVRATSHMRLRARDQVHFEHSHWWKRRAGPSLLLHIEGPTEYVNARWV
jgi:hypothetical protein